jgi:hypothetical protein
MGSTANDMHAAEDVVETLMEALMQEKQQSIKLMMLQLQEVRRKRRPE